MTNQRLVKMAQLAILAAIIFVMAFTPIGYIRTGGVEITLITIPVVLGAITMGPKYGAVLGALFGITSFIQCFGLSPFGAVLLSINPVLTFLICVPTRTLTGWLTGLIFNGLYQTKLNRTAAHGISNLSGALLNTLFFVGTLVLLFGRTEYIQELQESMGAANILSFAVLFVGINGLVEALICATAGTAVSRAVLHFQERQQNTQPL
ncbi:MAG: ECF transporter S component [Clostridiales bacterium]|nr:ECF transporter S component [Clostridiales bacterium]